MIVPMLASHVDGLLPHEYMGFTPDCLKDREYVNFMCENESYTVIDSGKVIGCFGFVEVGLSRYHGWSILSKDSGKHMLEITRFVKGWMERSGWRRHEVYVRCDFKQGVRWVELMGFECETPNGMKKYGDDGCDYYLYARCS